MVNIGVIAGHFLESCRLTSIDGNHRNFLGQIADGQGLVLVFDQSQGCLGHLPVQQIRFDGIQVLDQVFELDGPVFVEPNPGFGHQNAAHPLVQICLFQQTIRNGFFDGLKCIGYIFKSFDQFIACQYRLDQRFAIGVILHCALHVHGIGEDQALEAEVFAQQVCDNPGGEGRGQVFGGIQRWNAQVGSHNPRKPVVDQFPVGVKL